MITSQSAPVFTPPTSTSTPKSIALITYGTRGDVQPFVVIARALQARGHTVWIASSEDMQGFIEGAGVAYRRLRGDARSFLESPEGQKLLATGSVVPLARKMVAYADALWDPLLDDMIAAFQGADLVVGHMLMCYLHTTVCEILKIRYMIALPIPVLPTGAFVSPLVDIPAPYAWIRYWTHVLVVYAFWLNSKKNVNRTRQKLGYAPCKKIPWKAFVAQKMPMLHMVSEHLIPKPAEWDETQFLCGFLQPDASMRAGWQEKLPAHVYTFLDACKQKSQNKQNQKPFFCGFGSMPVLDPVKMLAMLQEALEKTDSYAIVGAGWTRLPEASEQNPKSRYILVGSIDHDTILPLCAGMIHHGGAGTTSTALRAGIPAAVFSVFGDQPFWGKMLRQRGAGIHFPFTKLGVETLSEAIQYMRQESVQQSAQAIGAQLRSENSAERAAVWIEQQIHTAPIPCL